MKKTLKERILREMKEMVYMRSYKTKFEDVIFDEVSEIDFDSMEFEGLEVSNFELSNGTLYLEFSYKEE